MKYVVGQMIEFLNVGVDKSHALYENIYGIITEVRSFKLSNGMDYHLYAIKHNDLLIWKPESNIKLAGIN